MEAPIHVPLGQDGGEHGRPAALTQPEVSIAIVSYNTRDLLRRCLATIAASGTTRAYEVIVVDNASTDGSREMVAEDYPGVCVLANGENAGYSRAVNQAIRAAAGRYVLVLNPDIEVLDGAIDALAGHLDRHSETGIAGGKLLNPDGSLQYSCRTFYTFSTLLHRRTPVGKLFPNSRVVRDHLMMDWDHDSEREVDWMLGACLMVRSEAIRDVGLMDERFFMYFEDVDWCYRMKQHGWKVVYVPAARMRHVHRRESARGGPLNARLLAHLNSMFRFFDKWNTLLYRLRRHRRVLHGAALLLTDVLAVNAAFLVAFGLRTLAGAVLHRPVFPLAAYEPFLLLMNLVVLAANATLGLYVRRATRDRWDDAFDLAKGLLLSTLVLMASTFLTGSELHSRFMVGAFVPIAFGLMLGGRALLAAGSRELWRGRYDLTRVVVLGERGAATDLAASLAERPEVGYEVVAALPDRPGREERRFREFWDADGIREVVRRHRVGEVLLVRPTLAAADIARLVLLCRRDGVSVRLVSGAADFLPGHVGVTELLGRPVADLVPPAGGAGQRVLRRAGDVVISGAALLLLGPVGWARAFRRPAETDPHELVQGMGGRVFRRRRPHRAAETLGHILRGDLALVGPRPASPEEVGTREGLRVLLDLVRPGATGGWRLHDREGLGEEEELSLALSYLQNQSPLEDLKIVLRTLARPRSTPEKRNQT
jgi:GT2 family glycosyltransferase